MTTAVISRILRGFFLDKLDHFCLDRGKVQAESHRNEFRDEIGPQGPLELSRSWWPHYQSLFELTGRCGAAITRFDRLPSDEPQPAVVLTALVWAVRLADTCMEIGNNCNDQWVASSQGRAYQVRAAALSIQASLPLDENERDLIRAAADTRRGRMALIQPELMPVLDKGHAWLAAPGPEEPGYGEQPYSGQRFFLDRARELIWYIATEELRHAPLDYDWTEDTMQWGEV